MTLENFELTMPNSEESLAQMIVLLRGTIISSYAQVEYSFTDFIARCQQISDYASICARIPHRLKGRLEVMRRLFSAPGPLHTYAEKIIPLVNSLIDYEHTRHIMAHGIMFNDYNKDEPVMTFITFQKFETDPLKIDRLQCTFRALEAKANEISRFSQLVLYGVSEIIIHLSLAQIPILFEERP